MRAFTIMLAAIAVLVPGQSVPAQSTAPELKHFAVRGLSFDYPAASELDDRSGPTLQHLVFQKKDQAQIMIVSRYETIATGEDLAAARRDYVDSFIETMWKQIREQDPNVARSVTQIEVAGQQAPGIKMRAVLENQPGNAEIYSLQLGPRLVVLSIIGTDQEIAAAAPAWRAIRHSLKMEASTESASVSESFNTFQRSTQIQSTLNLKSLEQKK